MRLSNTGIILSPYNLISMPIPSTKLRNKSSSSSSSSAHACTKTKHIETEKGDQLCGCICRYTASSVCIPMLLCYVMLCIHLCLLLPILRSFQMHRLELGAYNVLVIYIYQQQPTIQSNAIQYNPMQCNAMQIKSK